MCRASAGYSELRAKMTLKHASNARTGDLHSQRCFSRTTRDWRMLLAGPTRTTTGWRVWPYVNNKVLLASIISFRDPISCKNKKNHNCKNYPFNDRIMHQKLLDTYIDTNDKGILHFCSTRSPNFSLFLASLLASFISGTSLLALRYISRFENSGRIHKYFHSFFTCIKKRTLFTTCSIINRRKTSLKKK